MKVCKLIMSLNSISTKIIVLMNKKEYFEHNRKAKNYIKFTFTITSILIKKLLSLTLEEVTVRAGRKVLMDVDDTCALMVGDPRGILVKQLRPLHNPLIK